MPPAGWRSKACEGGFCLDVFGRDFFLNVFEKKSFHVALWGRRWRRTSYLGIHLSPSVRIRENPEFHGLMNTSKSTWPRCLSWHGWLPALAHPCGGCPWANFADNIAFHRLECTLGSYSDGSVGSGLLVPTLVTNWLFLVFLTILMFGLMDVLLKMSFLELVLAAVVCVLIGLVLVGFTGAEVILISIRFLVSLV